MREFENLWLVLNEELLHKVTQRLAQSSAKREADSYQQTADSCHSLK